MLLATLVGSKKVKDKRKISINPDPKGPLIGTFALRHVVDHDPSPDAGGGIYRWSFMGNQMIQVTIESAREDYGVVIPSGAIQQAMIIRRWRNAQNRHRSRD